MVEMMESYEQGDFKLIRTFFVITFILLFTQTAWFMMSFL